MRKKGARDTKSNWFRWRRDAEVRVACRADATDKEGIRIVAQEVCYSTDLAEDK